MPENLLQYLTSLKELSDVPQSSIQWMIDNGEVRAYKQGDFLFQNGDFPKHLEVILKGKFEVYRMNERGRQFLTDIETGTITSQLPYSRMSQITVDAEATEESEVFKLHMDNFTEMIQDHFELTRALVHTMTNRVRTYTQRQVQNEKLMALGKLSAGLAHELNNPASAMVRSAVELGKQLRHSPESFKKLLKIDIKESEIDAIQHVLNEKLNSPPTSLSMMQRSGLEENLADWFEAHGESNGFDYAENFVDFHFYPEDLEQIYQACGSNNLGPTLYWLNDQLSVVKMVSEIETASKRIGELIGSVKRYSYMDRDGDKQPVDINEGLQSTQTMLAHKARKNKVKVEEQLDAELPNIIGLPGEINQIWTNLIDNALDAMEENGGTLKIASLRNGHFAKVTITDTGPGIPDSVKGHIFEPFYTTKPQGKGTGLGLDIVRKIVEQHHAEIRVESQPGNTTFSVTFPLE